MGLFIGASILTILELFDYAYEVGLRLHTVISIHKSKTSNLHPHIRPLQALSVSAGAVKLTQLLVFD